MTPETFTRWRTRQGMKKIDAARALGLSPNTIAAYESGKAEIPLHVALACTALIHDLPPYGSVPAPATEDAA